MIAQALLVGVARYERVSPLSAAVHHDVLDVAAVLQAPDRGTIAPQDIVALLDNQATGEAIRAAFRRAAEQTPSDGTFLFYFSGHGERGVRAGREQSWLLPYDANLKDLDRTALSSDEVVDLLRAIGARRQVVMIDACHAGGVGSTKTSAAQPKGFGKSGIDALSVGAGRALLTSSRADEVSLILHGARNSVFTETLLEGLGGAAIDRGDGHVGVLDLFAYVSEQVPRRARQQPVLHVGDLETNFAISRRGRAAASKRTAVGPDLAGLLSTLYPTGPMHDDIWSRAGGDLSRLVLKGMGLAQWHAALRRIELGGGGVRLDQLMRTVADDFPGNPELAALAGRITP